MKRTIFSATSSVQVGDKVAVFSAPDRRKSFKVTAIVPGRGFEGRRWTIFDTIRRWFRK